MGPLSAGIRKLWPAENSLVQILLLGTEVNTISMVHPRSYPSPASSTILRKNMITTGSENDESVFQLQTLENS